MSVDFTVTETLPYTVSIESIHSSVSSLLRLGY